MIFNYDILILLHLIIRHDFMMRLYFTPVAGYLVLCDTQHLMNFIPLYISALLQVHATLIMKGSIPLGFPACRLGERSPLRAEAAREPYITILLSRRFKSGASANMSQGQEGKRKATQTFVTSYLHETVSHPPWPAPFPRESIWNIRISWESSPLR